MKKCNLCGKRTDNIVISSPLDGNICLECAKSNFIKTPDGSIVPNYYDKKGLLYLISQMDKQTQSMLKKKFREIQERYVYRIMDYSVYGDYLIILLKSRYRKKDTMIRLVYNYRTRNTGYEILPIYTINKNVNNLEM